MQTLTNLSIRAKLILAFTFILSLCAALGVFSIIRVNFLSSAADTIVANDTSNLPLGVILKDINEISALAAVEHVAQDPAQLQSIAADEQAIAHEEQASWTQYAPTMDPGEESDDGSAVQADFNQLANTFTEIGNLDSANNRPTAETLVLGPLQDETKAARSAMATDLAFQADEADGIAKDAKTARNSSILWIAIALSAMGVLAILITITIVKIVASPVAEMTGLMRKLAAGDSNIAIPGLTRRDEIGGMGRAVQFFKEAAIEKLRLEAQIEAARAASEEARRRQDAEREAAAEQLAFVVHSIATGLEKLSAGDLIFRLLTPFSAEYEKLRGDFNATMDKLRETMGAITSNAQGVQSAAREITEASDDLSRRTEQQAATLEETAAALDEITATVRTTATNASDARDAVTTAKQEAERSGEIVQETVTAMNGIESSSNQISSIITVIDEIAFQTNLLALNAGVEAARAGDAGRGFAVVATEVRALAQRSADAAKEIKTLISTSGGQVGAGVKLVGETGRALGRITDQVVRLNVLVTGIAASAQEQSTALAEVNAAVNQMDQVTQQNAAMVEQATAASHGLNAEAVELARAVGQFQIGQATRPAPAPARAPKPRAKPQPAPKPALAGGPDWDEF